ncbi:MAG: SMI1/KNR4 family protein [Candidatus Heimdallarchaeota archaeon]
MELVRIQALDRYLEDSAIEISFENGLTRMHIKEFLFFKDFDLPDYHKLFYEQTNGLLIESRYTKDEFGDASILRIHTLEDLFFTKKKVNFLPERRFIQIGSNDSSAFYLLDTENLDPNGNPLILLSMPADKFCIPLTNSFDVLLECSCIGLLGYLEQFGSEVSRTKQLSKKMLREKETIKHCLKDLFITAKREYELLDIWHLDEKAKKMVQFSTAKWFKEIKHLLSIIQ